MWSNLVWRLLWEQEVAGSSPASPISLEIIVVDALLVAPIQFKDKLNSKEQSVISSVVKNYEFFYRDKDSVEKFKGYVLANDSLKKVVFYYSDIIIDYKLIRALKSLRQDIKIILMNPQLQNLGLYLDSDENIFDDVYKLLKMTSDMEISNCKIADLIVVPTECEKENLLKKEINYVTTYDEILKNKIEYKESKKYLQSVHTNISIIKTK